MDKYHFEGQNPQEKILMLLRRHPLVLILSIIPLILAITIAIFIYYYLPFIVEEFQEGTWRNLWNLLASLAMMFSWTTFFIIFIDYYLDVWIVTNERIVDIEQKGLFNREIATLDLSKIQDVSMTQIGIIPTFFDYGDVQIQTAGSVPHFAFKQIKDPDKIRKRVINLYKATQDPNRDENYMDYSLDFNSQI